MSDYKPTYAYTPERKLLGRIASITPQNKSGYRTARLYGSKRSYKGIAWPGYGFIVCTKKHEENIKCQMQTKSQGQPLQLPLPSPILTQLFNEVSELAGTKDRTNACRSARR